MLHSGWGRNKKLQIMKGDERRSEYTNREGKSKEGKTGRGKDDRDGHGGEKIDRGEVKRVGSDEVERYKEDDAHTGRERRKGKCVDRD